MLDAEKYASLASLFGRPYAQDQFELAWKNLLFDHFHDVMPGSGIAVIAAGEEAGELPLTMEAPAVEESKISVAPAPTVKLVPSAIAVLLVSTSLPAMTSVPPLQVFEPLRINSPPPLRLSEQLLPLSLIAPAMLRVLPVETLALRLLASAIGTAIVLLPPLLPIVADPAVFDKINVLAPDGAIA